MSGDDDRPDYLDREKKSFSELDRARREGRDRGDERARRPADPARSKQATQQYLKQIDAHFSGGRSAEVERLAQAVLDARGTPELAPACRAYRAAAGSPTEIRIAACFLDSEDRELVLEGLAALEAAGQAGSLQASAGLKTQLRGIAEDPDDELAGAAEDLLDSF